LVYLLKSTASFTFFLGSPHPIFLKQLSLRQPTENLCYAYKDSFLGRVPEFCLTQLESLQLTYWKHRLNTTGTNIL